MSRTIERAFGPSLFFCALALFAWFTQGGQFAVGWGALACLFALFVAKAQRGVPLDALTLAGLAFAGWLLLDAAFVNPAWHADAFYFPLPFVVTLLTFRALAVEALPRYFGALLLFLLALGLHGMGQVYLHWGYLNEEWWPRATSIIRVPNTYATLINIGLLPLIALYLLRPARWLLALVAFLFAVLLLSQSRGGLLGFTAGAGFLLLALWRSRQLRTLPWRSLGATLLLTALAVALSKLQVGGPNFAERVATAVADKGTGRLYIYDIAWHLIQANPLTGYGYYNFQYFFLRDKYPHFGDGLAYFVHNDYLQIWLETGIVGLALLLLLIGLFYRSMAHSLPTAAGASRAALLGIGAAGTAVFAHAAVDYPLFPSVVTTLLGAALGAASGLAASAAGDTTAGRWLDRRPLRLLLVLPLAWWMGQPVMAQLHGERAQSRLLAGDPVAAVNNYTIARRYTPRDPFYYFAEAVVWYDAALGHQNREAAAQVDRLTAAGAAVNPYDFRNLGLRLTLNRDHAELLEHPADAQTLMRWAQTMEEWLPTDDSVSLQYAKTLVHIGRPEQARQHIEAYRAKGLVDAATASRWKQMLDLQ